MKLQLLISAVKADSEKLIKKMNVPCDGVLINQIGINAENEYSTKTGTVKVYKSDKKGVGASRNMAIDKSSLDILLFSDDDIEYVDELEDLVINEFLAHPEADGLFFNVKVCEERRTYFNEDFAPVTIRNSGRYPAYSFAVRRDKLISSGVKFSTLFGGGAKYSCGEDSLFFKDLITAGLKLYRTTAVIGEEIPRKSTWFKGYNEKYFFDRGVLYHFLYGKLAFPLGVRYVLKKRKIMCKTVSPFKAISLISEGIKEGKSIDK